MKVTKKLQEDIGKYVRFNMFGEHYAKITGTNKAGDAFFIEGPVLQETFNFDAKERDFSKAMSIQRVRTMYNIDALSDFEEVSEDEYKNHLFELLKSCSFAY